MNKTIIKRSDSVTKAAKAHAEHERLRRQRSRMMREGLKGGPNERRETLEKMKERRRQARADAEGHSREIFGVE